jgi:hypothetical protein
MIPATKATHIMREVNKPSGRKADGQRCSETSHSLTVGNLQSQPVKAKTTSQKRTAKDGQGQSYNFPGISVDIYGKKNILIIKII